MGSQAEPFCTVLTRTEFVTDLRASLSISVYMLNVELLAQVTLAGVRGHPVNQGIWNGSLSDVVPGAAPLVYEMILGQPFLSQSSCLFPEFFNDFLPRSRIQSKILCLALMALHYLAQFLLVLFSASLCPSPKASLPTSTQAPHSFYP